MLWDSTFSKFLVLRLSTLAWFPEPARGGEVTVRATTSVNPKTKGNVLSPGDATPPWLHSQYIHMRSHQVGGARRSFPKGKWGCRQQSKGQMDAGGQRAVAMHHTSPAMPHQSRQALLSWKSQVINMYTFHWLKAGIVYSQTIYLTQYLRFSKLSDILKLFMDFITCSEPNYNYFYPFVTLSEVFEMTLRLCFISETE